eukprot:Lithocolla_globosa_v1_NODE_3036_length_1785_cov_11.864740.p1 type:complete len:188 gc:universal NODE_3036_length_1785_cov_11.864740:750-1313(+)
MPMLLFDEKTGLPVPPADRDRFITNYFRKSPCESTDLTQLAGQLVSVMEERAALFSSPFDACITVDEVYDALLDIKAGRSPGLDGIPAELLQWLPQPAILALCALFNACLTHHTVPASWLHGKIIAILKPGRNEHDITSYRPITLLNTTFKLLERIFQKRLLSRVLPRICDEQAASSRVEDRHSNSL